jgi:hypothetical protein
LIRAKRAQRHREEDGKLLIIEAAAGTACRTCPWRITNQQQPPLDHPKAAKRCCANGAKAAAFATATVRSATPPSTAKKQPPRTRI